MEQTPLRFFDFSDDARLRFAEMLNGKLLSDRAKRFLRLSYDAAAEHGPIGLRVRYLGGNLWISCPQERLGELLQCSERTARDMLKKELEPTGVLKSLEVRPRMDGPVRTAIVYCVSIRRVAELPELDPTDELDAAILDTNGDPFGDRDQDGQTAPPVARSVTDRESPATVSGAISGGFSGAISGGFSGAISGGFSGGISGGSSVLMNHDHDHEGLNINSFTHDHDHEPTAIEPPIRPAPAAAGPARFDQIAERDLRGIAGFAVEIAGVTGVPNPRSRMRKLREYFADAIAAGHADPGEFALFGALFRHVGRRTDVKHRAKYLRTLWTNRTEKPLESVVTAADREYFRELLRAAPDIPELAGHACGS